MERQTLGQSYLQTGLRRCQHHCRCRYHHRCHNHSYHNNYHCFPLCRKGVRGGQAIARDSEFKSRPGQ